MAKAENDSLGQLIIGRRLLSIGEKDFSWFFIFGDNMSVATESPWRLISQKHIIVTSEDHAHQFSLPAPIDAAQEVLALIGGRVVDFIIHLPFHWGFDFGIQRSIATAVSSDLQWVRVVEADYTGQRDHLHGRRKDFIRFFKLDHQHPFCLGQFGALKRVVFFDEKPLHLTRHHLGGNLGLNLEMNLTR